MSIARSMPSPSMTYDALVIPGGQINPDLLRADKSPSHW